MGGPETAFSRSDRRCVDACGADRHAAPIGGNENEERDFTPRAEIVAGRVGAEQAMPSREFD